MSNEISNAVNQDFLIQLAKSADIQELDFSVRTFNGLKKSGINTIGELCEKTYRELKETKLIGRHSIDEIHMKLAMIGLCLRGPEGRVATKDDWKRAPLPYTSINTLIYLPLKWYEIEKLKMGFIPVDMDCKWFLYYENGKLYFHRSSSGRCYFVVTIDEKKFTHPTTAYVYDGEEVNRNIDDARSLILDLLRNFARPPYYNYGSPIF